jgi:hypothetical protein
VKHQPDTTRETHTQGTPKGHFIGIEYYIDAAAERNRKVGKEEEVGLEH